MRTDAGRIERLQEGLPLLAQEYIAANEREIKIAKRFIISIKYKNLGWEDVDIIVFRGFGRFYY